MIPGRHLTETVSIRHEMLHVAIAVAFLYRPVMFVDPLPEVFFARSLAELAAGVETDADLVLHASRLRSPFSRPPQDFPELKHLPFF